MFLLSCVSTGCFPSTYELCHWISKHCQSASCYWESSEALPPGSTDMLTIVMPEPNASTGRGLAMDTQWPGGTKGWRGAKTSIKENRGGIITLNNSQLAGFAHPPLRTGQINSLSAEAGRGRGAKPLWYSPCTVYMENPQPPLLTTHIYYYARKLAYTWANAHTGLMPEGVFALKLRAALSPVKCMLGKYENICHNMVWSSWRDLEMNSQPAHYDRKTNVL